MGVDISGLNPTLINENDERTGEYFGSNWWAWRPIHMLCDVVSLKYNLNLNTYGWGENSGYGIQKTEECEKLANAIETYIESDFKEILDDDVIYLSLGCWVTKDGKFISDEDEAILQNDYPIGRILFNGIVLKNGTVAYPAHGTTINHIKNWIKFLRNCGGFEIY